MVEPAAIEQSPQSGKFAGFVSEVHDDASDLNGAIETALALIPQDSPGRILLLSDGRWTGKAPSEAAARAAGRGIAIDYRLIQRDTTNDIAITHVDAPDAVAPGESFMLAAWINSPIQEEVSFELMRGNQRLASGRRKSAIRIESAHLSRQSDTTGYSSVYSQDCRNDDRSGS